LIKLFTIGFANKTAQKFFELLSVNNVQKIIDIRVNNTSQLSGFAKAKDLEFFAGKICNISYTYMPDFAPTKELLSQYRVKKITWDEYTNQYLELIKIRVVEKTINIEEFHNCCLLCSEHLPQQCHRRLLAEYLQSRFCNIEIHHLK